MTDYFHHPHWAMVANWPENDLKEALITGYKSGKPFTAHNFQFFFSDLKAPRILDFGCGIGRNFSTLKSYTEELVAFDIPEMVTACRHYQDCDGVALHSDWNVIANTHYDVVVATLVFQHIGNPDTFQHVVSELAHICDFLYISTRCWSDGDSHPNVFSEIKKTGLFTYVKGTLPEDEALSIGYPDEDHVELLLRNSDKSMHRRSNDRLFDIHEMDYKPNALRLPITIAQFFTPNYDHWAYKVLSNKKIYCDRHGYRFHYRRGIYDHAQDRHPSWHRIPLLLELFKTNETEWVFWSDIDSLIMRQDVRLEWFIGNHTDKDLIVPNQGAGLFLGELVTDCICFGQFFIRNTDWSIRFLEAIWNFPDQYGYPEYLQEESWEQEAVNYFYHRDVLDFSDHASIVPNRLFNSFHFTQYRENDFLIHFAGEQARGEGRRESLINEYLGTLAPL